MSDSKKFFELVSKDNAVKAELEQASLEALKKVLEDKGLGDEAKKALSYAMTQVAEAHGCKLGGMEEVSPEEMKAVAGGYTCSGAVLHVICDVVTWGN